MFSLRSSSFAEGSEIPKRYTCDGENVSPGVEWSDVPQGTKSLLLLMYDADAGRALGASVDLGFVHWLVLNLPPEPGSLPEGASRVPASLSGALEAKNDFAASAGRKFPGGALIAGKGYDGPCPPAPHRYVLRLMALDRALDLAEGASPPSVLKAMAGHAIAVADWTGTYGSSR
jgi:Raf kinase inhibitor-like YbhB/YbcL family protein